MAIAYSASGEGGATATNEAALELLCPAVVNAGQILIAHVCHRNNSTAPTLPKDWTPLAGPENAGVAVVTGRHWAFGKIADGTEDGTKVNFGTAGGTDVRHGQLHSFNGRVSGSLLELVVGFVATSHNTDPQMPKVTTTIKDALAVGLVYQADNNSLPAKPTGESGGSWKEVAGFVTSVGLDGVQQVQVAIPTANPGTIEGGALAAEDDPSGVIGFEIRPEPLSGGAGASPGTLSLLGVGR